MPYVFEKSGYKAQPIKSYEGAFTACVAQPPDTLILGCLPLRQDEALELCRKLRETLTMPHFPIIMGHVDLVASHREEAHQRIYDAGVNACFGRVYDIVDVLELIAPLLADPTATGLMDRQSLRLRTHNHS